MVEVAEVTEAEVESEQLDLNTDTSRIPSIEVLDQDTTHEDLTTLEEEAEDDEDEACIVEYIILPTGTKWRIEYPKGNLYESTTLPHGSTTPACKSTTPDCNKNSSFHTSDYTYETDYSEYSMSKNFGESTFFGELTFI